MTERLRLLTYNIMEGLRPIAPSDDERRRIDRDRLTAAQSLVAELAPDILVLNEALFCRLFEGAAIDYAKLFGFPHQVSELYDREWGNAILSRFPLQSLGEMRIYNRGGLRARIDTRTGPVCLASYHPHPGRRPENKALDFVSLIEGLDGPCIVCGDFNAISPEDPIDKPTMLEGFKRFSPEPEAALDRFIDSGHAVFSVLGARGLRDAIPPDGRRHTMPTDLLSSEKDGAMRLDHIFVSPEFDILASEIIHSPLTHKISDHHPVIADLRLRT